MPRSHEAPRVLLAEWTGHSRTPSKPVDFHKKILWRRYKCPGKNGTPCCDTCHCSRIVGACVLLSPPSWSPWLSPVPGPHDLRNGRAVQPHGNQSQGRKIGLLCLWDWHSHINKVGAPGREISQTDHAVKSKPLRRLPGYRPLPGLPVGPALMKWNNVECNKHSRSLWEGGILTLQ